ncbi:MAG: hypothetical protein RLZZ272_587 [Actinomycetota bacterium]
MGTLAELAATLPLARSLGMLAVTVFVAPLWPWSRGWTWAPAGMLAMGLAALVLFSLTVVPVG